MILGSNSKARSVDGWMDNQQVLSDGNFEKNNTKLCSSGSFMIFGMFSFEGMFLVVIGDFVHRYTMLWVFTKL